MRAFALLLLAAAAPALADDTALLRCRAIKDATARLACYDAIAVPSTPAATAAAPGAAPAAAAAAPAGKKAEPTPAQQFGFEHKTPVAQLDAVESTIPGRFEGWGPGQVIRFANGQAWQVADDSKGALWVENPKVRVRRGLLGAFYLEIEGTNRSPRVIRIK
jgi:hypothetical protein